MSGWTGQQGNSSRRSIPCASCLEAKIEVKRKDVKGIGLSWDLCHATYGVEQEELAHDAFVIFFF